MINDRLKTLRKNYLKLTQAELADILGIVSSFISDVELGKNTITTKIILGLQKKFSVSIDWLLTGKGDIFIPEFYKGSSISELEYEYKATDKDTGLIDIDIRQTKWFKELNKDKKFILIAIEKINSEEKILNLKHWCEMEILMQEAHRKVKDGAPAKAYS